MIHYLKIENFGPIKDLVELNFEAVDVNDQEAYEVQMPDGKKILKLAYIYGPNASGKTTVLKAFEFLRKLLLKPVSEKALTLDFEPFLFCDDPQKNPSFFEVSFYADGMRYVYSIHFSKEAILDEKIVFYQSVKPTELFSRTTDLQKRLTSIQFGSKVKVPVRERDLIEGNTLHNNTVFGAYAKTNVDIPELEKLNKWFATFLLGMITSAHNLTQVTASLIDENPKVNKWINSFLNKADQQISAVQVADPFNHISIPLDEAFPDFSFQLHPQGSFATKTGRGTASALTRPIKYYGGPSQRKIDFVHKLRDNKSYVLSILTESSGTKRYFGLGGPLYELIHNSHLLCIDELETSLHPDLMQHFLQLFLLNSTTSQLLITTHNTSLMENQDFIRRDALWFTEKEENGAASLYSAADFDSSKLRKDSNIIKAYKSGKLGAKPNLGSPFLTDK